MHEVPQHFKKAIIVPIPKGLKDNYRGISLLPVLSKVYEQLLLDWYSETEITRVNHLQTACQPRGSSLQTTTLLREVISYNTSRGNNVYVALLDTQKAFDSVWIDALFYKLNAMGCNQALWRILYFYYTDFQGCVFTVRKQSDWFDILVGVHQGAPFSMKMYTTFNSDLLDLLCRISGKATIPGINVPVCAPAYADDIAVVAIYKPALQNMLDVAYSHSCR